VAHRVLDFNLRVQYFFFDNSSANAGFKSGREIPQCSSHSADSADEWIFLNRKSAVRICPRAQSEPALNRWRACMLRVRLSVLPPQRTRLCCAQRRIPRFTQAAGAIQSAKLSNTLIGANVVDAVAEDVMFNWLNARHRPLKSIF
jgi:hypothetical protein